MEYEIVEIRADEVHIQAPNQGKGVLLSFETDDIEAMLEGLEINDSITTKWMDKVLDEIGINYVKQYFNLVEKE